MREASFASSAQTRPARLHRHPGSISTGLVLPACELVHDPNVGWTKILLNPDSPRLLGLSSHASTETMENSLQRPKPSLEVIFYFSATRRHSAVIT